MAALRAGNVGEAGFTQALSAAHRTVRSLDPTVLFSPDGGTRVQLGSLSRTTKDILREGLQGDHLFIVPASLFEGKTNYADIEFLVLPELLPAPEDAHAHRRHLPAAARPASAAHPHAVRPLRPGGTGAAVLREALPRRTASGRARRTTSCAPLMSSTAPAGTAARRARCSGSTITWTSSPSTARRPSSRCRRRRCEWRPPGVASTCASRSPTAG